MMSTLGPKPHWDLGPPPAEVIREYAWTWRTCPTCVTHVKHAPGDACNLLCANAPWFIVFWKHLVATLRVRPDRDAVLGEEHYLELLPYAMECPTCSKVAYKHLRCFQGLFIVEVAKRIAEVPFEL